MEKDSESWFHHQHLDRESPNLNSYKTPFDLGTQYTVPAYMNRCANVISTNGTLPEFEFSGLPNSKASHLNEPCGWFYCLPRTRHAFAPVLNSLPKEKLPADVNENCGADAPNVGSGCAQKKFLVFDQSGDQTTVIFSSGIGTPVQCLTSWNPKPAGAYELNKVEPGIKGETNYPSGPFLANDYHEDNQRDDVGSEMHEDTEELNALLYSDDDDDGSEDDEVTSTGHSPGTMTTHDKQDWFEESDEEVASSAGPVKRQKLFDGGYNVPSLINTAGYAKPYNSSEYEDDAESSCGDDKNQVFGESDSLSGNKRSRKEKIRETINILQTIIPGGKGKDSIAVIDEAIHYLRSLKSKAKAFGLGPL